MNIPKEVLQGIDGIILKFPLDKACSAVLMSLRLIQDHDGYLTRDRMDQLASYLDMPKMTVYEVAHFYSLFRHEKQGRVCVKVCQGLPCALNGAKDVLHALESELEISVGESSKDGQWTLLTTECQASCVKAPVVLINDEDIESLKNIEDITNMKKRYLKSHPPVEICDES